MRGARGVSSAAGGRCRSEAGRSQPSRIRCAFVPESPNELTPARPPRPSASGQSRSADTTRTGNSSHAIRGFRTLEVQLRRDPTPTPAPAAPSQPPLPPPPPPGDPRSSSPSPPAADGPHRAPPHTPGPPLPARSGPPTPYPCRAPPGSPPKTPRSPPADSASRITRSCAGPFGTVRPALAPSWFTADPSTTPRTRSPARSASARRFSATTPQPSPRTKPSAPASNARQRPPGDSICASPRRRVPSGSRIAFTPPASARSTSPRSSAETAWWIATSDEEHAVSTASAGPPRPNVYATRPIAVEGPVPVVAYRLRPPSPATPPTSSR